MPFIPVPLTAQFEMIFDYNGEVGENVLYFTNDTEPWDETNLETVAAELEILFAEVGDVIYHTSTKLVSIKATSLASQTAPGIEYPVIPNIPGLGGGEALPNNVAAVATFITALRGRSYRGRNYLGGMSEFATSGNTLQPAHITAAGAWFEGLIAMAASLNITWVVVSRQENNVPRVTGVATPITAYRINPTVRTQKRRLPRS